MSLRASLIFGLAMATWPGSLSAQVPPSFLDPEDVRELPPRVAAGFDDVGCAVPQAWPMTLDGVPHNVVRGEFGAVGQQDWAALCSKDGISSIHVVFGGPAICPSPINPLEDRVISQRVNADGTAEFSRLLEPIQSLRSVERPELRAPFDSIPYDGLADRFVEKGATIFACVNGRWLSFGID